MIQISINMYKVVCRYTQQGQDYKSEHYFTDLEKAIQYAEENKDLYYTALHELRENEKGELTSAKCLEVWHKKKAD